MSNEKPNKIFLTTLVVAVEASSMEEAADRLLDALPEPCDCNSNLMDWDYLREYGKFIQSAFSVEDARDEPGAVWNL